VNQTRLKVNVKVFLAYLCRKSYSMKFIHSEDIINNVIPMFEKYDSKQILMREDSHSNLDLLSSNYSYLRAVSSESNNFDKNMIKHSNTGDTNQSEK